MLLLFYAGFFQGTAIVAKQPAAARPAFAPLAVRYVQALALYYKHFQPWRQPLFFFFKTASLLIYNTNYSTYFAALNTVERELI